MTRALIVFARAPSAPGKSRLTAGLSSDRARTLREALFLDTLEVAHLAQAQITVAFTPESARDEIATLTRDDPLLPQRGCSLGNRMLHAIGESFATGAASVVLIGSDLPSLPVEHVRDAFTRLDESADCVFGPAADGGYYLVGARRRGVTASDAAGCLRNVFEGISWGTGAVLSESLAAAAAGGLSVALVAPWWDVDLPKDLERVVTGADRSVAPRTRAWWRMQGS